VDLHQTHVEDIKVNIIDIRVTVLLDSLILHHLKHLNQLLVVKVMARQDLKEEGEEVITQDSLQAHILELVIMVVHNHKVVLEVKGDQEVTWEAEKVVM